MDSDRELDSLSKDSIDIHLHDIKSETKDDLAHEMLDGGQEKSPDILIPPLFIIGEEPKANNILEESPNVKQPPIRQRKKTPQKERDQSPDGNESQMRLRERKSLPQEQQDQHSDVEKPKPPIRKRKKRKPKTLLQREQYNAFRRQRFAMATPEERRAKRHYVMSDEARERRNMSRRVASMTPEQIESRKAYRKLAAKKRFEEEGDAVFQMVREKFNAARRVGAISQEHLDHRNLQRRLNAKNMTPEQLEKKRNRQRRLKKRMTEEKREYRKIYNRNYREILKARKAALSCQEESKDCDESKAHKTFIEENTTKDLST